jgi:hypothetical protein
MVLSYVAQSFKTIGQQILPATNSIRFMRKLRRLQLIRRLHDSSPPWRNIQLLRPLRWRVLTMILRGNRIVYTQELCLSLTPVLLRVLATSKFRSRKRVQWYTFWVAVLVLLLTIVFGLIQSVSSVVQAWASVKALP